MKKVFALLMAAAMILSLAACGNKNPDSNPDSNDDTGHSTCATVDAATPPSKNGKIRPNERPVAASTPETLRSGISHPCSQQHASPP